MHPKIQNIQNFQKTVTCVIQLLHWKNLHPKKECFLAAYKYLPNYAPA